METKQFDRRISWNKVVVKSVGDITDVFFLKSRKKVVVKSGGTSKDFGAYISR